MEDILQDDIKGVISEKFEDRPIDILENAAKIEEEEKIKSDKRKKSLGTLITETKTKLVRGRRKYKIRHRHPATAMDPEGMTWCQETWPVEFSDLEKMYQEFCEKAYKYIATHREHQGADYIHRVLFPDFQYEIIPERFTVE